MCRLESVLFLCTVHISEAQRYDFSLSNRLCLSVARGFVLPALLRFDFTVVKTVPIPVETCNGSSFPYEYDQYEILGLDLF